MRVRRPDTKAPGEPEGSPHNLPKIRTRHVNGHKKTINHMNDDGGKASAFVDSGLRNPIDDFASTINIITQLADLSKIYF